MRREDDFDPGKDEGSGERIGPALVPSRGVSPKWIGAGIAGLLLAIFAIANSKRVQVNFLFFTTQARLVTVILVAAVLGFIVGWFIGRPSRAERRAMQRGMND